MPVDNRPTCQRCAGGGTIPRTQRRFADGSLDPTDKLGQSPQICDRCGGDGREPAVQRATPTSVI